MLGFRQFRTAAAMIAGIELLRRIHKGQFKLGKERRNRLRPPTRADAPREEWRAQRCDRIDQCSVPFG
jgi:hypothetical protein